MSQHSENLRRGLLKLLGDQAFHSGTGIARSLSLSRTAVWKHLRHLRDCGIQIDSVRGRGYRLAQPLEMLDEQNIRASLSPAARSTIRDIRVLFETTSTSDSLVESLPSGPFQGQVLLAEYQSRGRGRRGNDWVSPMASAVCLSLGWHYEVPPANLQYLSLSCGVAMMRLFDHLDIPGVGLKWPNDILAGDRKLGGILVETRGEQAGPADVVIGIGINFLQTQALDSIDQPATAVAALTGALPSRNLFAAGMINELVAMLQGLPQRPAADILDDWRRHDCARGRPARVSLPDADCRGSVIGIDDDGLLLMRVDDEIRTFTAGQVSLEIGK